MFSKFISVLLLVAPLASAITLNAITGTITSGGPITITWTPGSNDPDSFSFELVNPSFNNAFAIANNVDPSLGTFSLTLPVVPVGTDYTIEAVNIGNINQVYSTTPVFSIGPTASNSVTATTGTSTNTNTPTAANLPVTTSTTVTGVSSSLLGTETGTVIEGTSTGTENSPTSTGTDENSPSATGTETGTGTGTSSTSSSTPSSAAVSSRLPLTSSYGFVVLLLSAVGGAVAIAL